MADHTGQQLGNYRLIRLLGAGGFAEVYLGEHIYLNTQAAIKVLHTQLAGIELEDFRNEARTIAHLEHPHIVRVLEFGVESETPYLVMSYAPNGTLRQRHPKGVRLPLPIIVTYIKQVADALQYAHDEKLIHRDIKPENMLLSRRDEVLLSDFGIATIARTSRAESVQQVVGTAAYMAPEQIKGHPRFASDQYSLGIVVYEWLSGDRPFGGSFVETCSQQLFAHPPSLRAKIQGVSPDVEQVVMKALEKDPYQRYPSVRAFADALEQADKSAQPMGTVAPPHSVIIPQTQTCARCGMPLPPGIPYCGNCGHYNTSAFEQAQQTVRTPQGEYTPPGPPGATRYGEQPGNSTVWTPANTSKPGTLFPQHVEVPQKQPGSKRGLVTGLAALLLLVLVAAGFVVYPYLSGLISNNQASNLPCITPTPAVRPLFGDCFVDNRNQWDLSNVPGQYSAAIENGSIILEDDNHQLLAEPVRASPGTFADFTLNVDAVLSGGDQNNGYGIYIRGTLNSQGAFKTYYRFELIGDGTYAIYKGDINANGKLVSTKLVDFTADAAIQKQGSLNHISIMVRGSSMTFITNGKILKTINDNSYKSGAVALFVSNLSSSTTTAQATFSRLVIYSS